MDAQLFLLIGKPLVWGNIQWIMERLRYNQKVANAAAVTREYNHGEAGSFGGTLNTKIVIFEVKINDDEEILEDFEMCVGLII